MGKKYCCVPGCSNTSQTLDEYGNKIILHRFPMSEKKAHIKRLWIQRLRHVRANLVVKDHTRVCSVHFEGTFTEESIPTIFPSKPKKETKSRRPLVRKIENSFQNDGSGQSDTENPQDNPVSMYNDVAIQTDLKYFYSKDAYTNTEEHCVHVSTATQTTGSPLSTVNAEVQADLPRMTYEDMKDDDSKTRFYTGFATFQIFWMFFAVLRQKHGAEKLNYWEGETRSMGEKSYHEPGVKKPGRKRSLRPVDEFLMVCMRLRLGLLQEHLADIFRVSETTVSRVMNTWINFLYDHCKSLIKWVSREQILCNLPKLFSMHADTRIVLDCTEFFIEKPSSLKAQWMTWSEYKHSNTFKILIGVSPSGMVTFVSRLWGGNVSDRHITQHDGFLPKLSPGDVVMADKGFTIEDLLPADVGLNVPPRVSSTCQMSKHDFFKTNRIASARIVVEMKMEQIKNYNIVNSVLPISEVHLSEQIIVICTSLTNLLPPLLK
ncbi:uncharacterized protein LOC134281470 [Saccostrea cucullata]|uniref:uncharacterized protein LOC134246461 n=3 Tax=Saccostrea cuccullata TaxID=36930 RepID=UPI002ED0E3B0